jgi:hypothetical protein
MIASCSDAQSLQNLSLYSQSQGNSEIMSSDSEFDDEYEIDFKPPPILVKATDPNFLPRLTTLVTDAMSCRALAPGRPLIDVTVVCPMSIESVPDQYIKSLAVRLGKASAPLLSITFPSRIMERRPTQY